MSGPISDYLALNVQNFISLYNKVFHFDFKEDVINIAVLSIDKLEARFVLIIFLFISKLIKLLDFSKELSFDNGDDEDDDRDFVPRDLRIELDEEERFREEVFSN